MRNVSGWIALSPLMVALAGCSTFPGEKAGGDAKQAPAVEPALQEKKQSGIVELAEDALRQAQIQTLLVSERSVPLVVRATGRLTADENRTWRVGARTDGQVIRTFANAGDRVAEGFILARIHSHDIHEARAEFRKAVGERARLNSQLEFARRQRDRMRRLYLLKAASQEQVDHAETECRNAEVAVSNAEADVTRTRLHLVEFLGVTIDEPDSHSEPVTAKSHSPDLHEEDLIPVRAPESGIVLERMISAGTAVNSGSPLFVIADLRSLWAIASVQEEHLGKIRPGMQARVSVQAYPDRTFVGKVGRIAEALDPSTRTAAVRIELSNAASLLKPEMYASIELEAGGSQKGLFVPQSSVQDVNQQSAVFVQIGPGKFEMKPVLLGQVVQGDVEIVSGLKPGETVVTHGSFTLKSQLLKASLAEEE